MAVTDEAIDKIKEMIVSGELGPGDRLPKESDLADRLGLSRNSLREAVKALSLIHVLDVRQGDGTYVTSLDPRLLDGIIWHATPGQVRAGVDGLMRRCASVGDDPDRIERTVLLECRIFDSVIDRDRWLATPYVVIFWSEHPDLYMQRNAVGTVATVHTQLERYVEAGATQFLVWFRDYPDLTSMGQLITQVAPGLPEPRPLAAKAVQALA